MFGGDAMQAGLAGLLEGNARPGAEPVVDGDGGDADRRVLPCVSQDQVKIGVAQQRLVETAEFPVKLAPVGEGIQVDPDLVFG